MPALYHVAGPGQVLEQVPSHPYVPMVGHEMRIWHLMDIIAGSTPAELATVLAEANNMPPRRRALPGGAVAPAARGAGAGPACRRRLDCHVMAVSWADVPMSKAIYVDPT